MGGGEFAPARRFWEADRFYRKLSFRIFDDQRLGKRGADLLGVSKEAQAKGIQSTARKTILIRDPSSEMRSNSWNSQCLHRMHQRVSTHLKQNRQKIVGNFEPKLRAASFVQGSHAERENSRSRVVVGIFKAISTNTCVAKSRIGALGLHSL